MQNQDNRVVKIQKHFAEPPHEVWHAWTDAEVVKLWFGSDPNGEVLSALLDVRLNGAFEITFANADKTTFTCFGTYQEVIPDQKLAFTWRWKSSPDMVEFVTVELEEEQGGTFMSFEIANIDANTTHGYSAGWNTTFEKLAQAMQRGSQDQ